MQIIPLKIQPGSNAYTSRFKIGARVIQLAADPSIRIDPFHVRSVHDVPAIGIDGQYRPPVLPEGKFTRELEIDKDNVFHARIIWHEQPA